MPAVSTTTLKSLKGVAAAEQRHRPGSERAAEAAAAYRRAATEERIRQLVESAPELSPEQRDRLALLLRPTPEAGRPTGSAA